VRTLKGALILVLVAGLLAAPARAAETLKIGFITTLSGPQGGGVLASVGGMLHAIGGRVTGDDVFGTHNVYNPATNSWSEAAPLPTPRDHAAAFVVDGKIHVIGGRLGATEANVGLHDIFDPATGRWTRPCWRHCWGSRVSG